jgi:dipicolinate synthase subunit B
LAKLAAGIVDTTVCMAVKSHLRTERPVVLCIATNDALRGNAANIGILLNRKHFYFVPFGQDDYHKKPSSLVADFHQIPETLQLALCGQQKQPLLLGAN